MKPLPTGDGRSFVVPLSEAPVTISPPSDLDEWDTPVSTVRRTDYEERKAATTSSGALSNQQDLYAGPAAKPVLWRSTAAATGEEGRMEPLLSDTATTTVDALTSEESFEDGGRTHGRKKRRKPARQTSAPAEDLVEFDDAFSTAAAADRVPAHEERNPGIAPWD